MYTYRILINLALWVGVAAEAPLSPASDSAPVLHRDESADLSAAGDWTALDERLRSAVEEGRVPGVAVMVVRRGAILFESGYGNLPADRAVRLGSSTKPVSATAVMTLVNAGRLRLDDRLGDLLPEFQGTPAAGATVRQLLSHSAGMPSRYPGGRPRTGTLAEFSKRVASSGLVGEPGTFAYSGVSIDIACRVAESVHGAPFEDLVRRAVWEPLGMTDTSFTMAADPSSVPAETQERGEGRYVSGGGGLSGTLHDLAAFYQMHVNGGAYGDRRVLSEASVEAMHARHATNQQRGSFTGWEYGLGFYRDRVAEDGRAATISHGGAFGTYAWADLDRDLVCVVFTEVGLPRAAAIIGEVTETVRATVPASRPMPIAVAHVFRGGNGGRAGAGDRVRNGRIITREQFRERFGDRFSQERIDALFDRLDANGDGKIQPGERGSRRPPIR